jgi:chromosome segregation protein
MVDQALALRPEERRPLFEEVAGVRRHERRRRRAEEQFVESEANLARVDDILAELRPQAKRLAQQAEQQANRHSAADDLAAAILASAHARWFSAGSRAVASMGAVAAARAVVDAAMTELLERERSIAAAGATLDGQVVAESAARAALDRARADQAALQLREGRHASELEAARRERAGLEDARAAAAADVAAARQVLALPMAQAATELEAELAALDAEITAAGSSTASEASTSPADAAAIRRLEAARAQEIAAARRRAAEAEHAATEERARATSAGQRTVEAAEERAAAETGRVATAAEEVAARTAREAAQVALAEAESAARTRADLLAGARAAAAAVVARHEDARRALEAADGAAFSRAARARGGRAIGDGLIIEAPFQRAVDAALAGLGRAHVLPRSGIAAIAADRGVAIAAEAIAAEAIAGTDQRTSADAGRQIVDAARARGGGSLAEAVRRDDSGAVRHLLARILWLPDAAACLDLQASLPAGWQAVARDGSLVVGDAATWIRPDGRGLHLKADVDQLAAERTRAEREVTEAELAHASADASLAAARTALATARDREAAAGAARRRADEVERAATARADAAAREAAWLDAQAARLQTEALRLRAAAPADVPEPDAARAAPTATTTPITTAEPARERAAALRHRRETLAVEVAAARAARIESERRRAGAEAAVALAERQLAYAARTAGDLAEREARLATEREDLLALLVDAGGAVTDAEAVLASIVASATAERERLRAAETAVSSLRERVRGAQEASRIAERDELEARLALESLREGLLVELSGLGQVGLRQLAGIDSIAPDAIAQPDDDLEPEVLEQALAVAAAAWERTEAPAEPPTPTRLATLRRRFHDLGAVNPFAADEYAEARTRLDGLEGQRSDIQSAIEHTRALISELDTLVSEQFRRTFAALERAFDERFQQLFGGGFAKLSLTDPQDLASTGIEITARPPGKKPQALAMLSGGERSLTAVALLFAMLEVRPVPFCVLDEVDAALDEANIGRFTDALRDLSRTTQCIVITHNRGTIEVADAMYGVTVGDDSVSRVISLRLDEATALADRVKRERPEAIPVGFDTGTE